MTGVKGKNVKFAIGSATFENPVFLASGPAGYGTEYAGLIKLDRLGAIVTKTITYEPREGNRGRRLWETSAGLLNSIGLENVGSRAFFADKLPALLDAGATPVVSLGAEDWDDYVRLLDAAAGSGAEAFELNLSCPNVDRGGMIVGSEPELLAAYVRRARATLAGKVIVDQHGRRSRSLPGPRGAGLSTRQGGSLGARDPAGRARRGLEDLPRRSHSRARRRRNPLGR